jgi:hypothetical protein
MKQTSNNEPVKKGRSMLIILIILIISVVATFGTLALKAGSEDAIKSEGAIENETAELRPAQKAFFLPGDSIMQIYVISQETVIVSFQGQMNLTPVKDLDPFINNYKGNSITIKCISDEAPLWVSKMTPQLMKGETTLIMSECSEREMAFVIDLFSN